MAVVVNEVHYCPLCLREWDSSLLFCAEDGARLRPLAERGAQWVGRLVADRYRVLRFLDAGGTSEIYEAERCIGAKRVALKLLHAAMAQEGAELFRHEAELVSRIAHPNVVAIEDFGTLPDGIHFMVLELLNGHPLSVELAARTVPVASALKYAMQACEGLAAAHDRGVLHCDIKPANLFLHGDSASAEQTIKILDLGIGRWVADDVRQSAVPGVVSGTPEYMSPEQALGLPLQAQSDVYSMGMTIWEMLLGEVPFQSSDYAEVLAMQVRTRPVWPSELAAKRGVPAEVAELLGKALAKNPVERQATMLELQAGLAAIYRIGRAHARSEPTSERANPTSQRAVKPASMAPVAATHRPRVSDPRRVPLREATGADDEVVEVAPQVWWVGRRRGQALECNAFLRVFRDAGHEVSLLIDPGPPEDFGVVSRKVAAVIGSVEKVDYIFLSHEDPDVASNAATIQQASPRSRVLCSDDTFRHARLYGLDPRRFSAVGSNEGQRLRLKTGHELEFVRAPFCHARGALMLFDRAERVLFSGDVFSGAQSPDLMARGGGLAGIELFHQLYMPSSAALGAVVERIRRLALGPVLLAPQHGSLVAGQDVARVVEHVAGLEVGPDFGDQQRGDAQWLSAARDLAREFRELAGHDRLRELLTRALDSSLPQLFVLDDAGEIASCNVAPQLAFEALSNDALAALPAHLRGDLGRSLQLLWKQHGLERPRPTPPRVT